MCIISYIIGRSVGWFGRLFSVLPSLLGSICSGSGTSNLGGLWGIMSICWDWRGIRYFTTRTIRSSIILTICSLKMPNRAEIFTKQSETSTLSMMLLSPILVQNLFLRFSTLNLLSTTMLLIKILAIRNFLLFLLHLIVLGAT